MHRRSAIALAGTVALAGARSTPAQSPTPSYAAAQLHCARFLETSRSEIETETAGGTMQAGTTREGIWSFRAHDTTGGVALEGWYDSLALARRTAETTIVADADGLIGGRYRGLLRQFGAYAEIARPFVPDEVAEIADLSGVAGDLLPPLPPHALRPGESWTDSARTLARLPDTVVAGSRLMHFRLSVRAESREATPRGDTTPIPLRQSTVEEGDFYWSRASGLVRRSRDITVEAMVPAGGRVRRPARSRVVQHLELTRLPARVPCR